MHGLTGPFIAVAALLALGGILDLRRPAATVGALRALGLPASRFAVRVGAAVAAAVAIGAVVSGQRLFALGMAVFYLLFAGFVAAALVGKVPLATCGCFGADDTPATFTHLAVNVAAAVVAAVVGLGPARRDWVAAGVSGGSALVGFLFVLMTVATVSLAYLALTLLPRVFGARPRPARSPG